MTNLYEVKKHPAPFNGLKWCFSIPTKNGWKGQLLSYRTKKAAQDFADKFEHNIEGNYQEIDGERVFVADK